MNLSGLEENKNIPVLGIIGFNFLSRFEVVTDYQKREITFFTLDGKGNRKSDASLHNDPTETIPLKKNRHLFFLEAELEEGTLKLGLDTGAEATVISKGAAEKIRSWFVPSTPVSIVAYNGKMETVNTGKVLQVVIGETMLDLPRVLLVDLSSLNRYMIKSLDGILGFDFFSAYKTAVNYKAGSLSIWSNAQWLVGE